MRFDRLTFRFVGNTAAGLRLTLSLILVLCGMVFGTASDALALTPTIHSVTAGGNWSDVKTWVENRVPTEADIVEINGMVSVIGATTSGIVVKSDAVLQNYYNTNYTLTVNGDVLNNGTIRSYNYYLFMNVSGNITNNGTWNNYQLSLTGTQSKSISGTSPISCSNIVLEDNFEVTGLAVLYHFLLQV